MNVAVFSTKPYDRRALDAANNDGALTFTYLEPRLMPETAQLAAGHPAVCAFVNDHLDREVLTILTKAGTRLIALRSAGFNNVDLEAAKELGLAVVRVPAYSPNSIAEHTVGLMLALNRRLHRAYNRVREGNFALDGLLGFDMVGKTVGIIGTGKIGAVVAQILSGFGCQVLGYDPYPSDAARDAGVEYRDLDEVFAAADILTLHLPLTRDTHHMIDAASIASMKPGVMLINTSRGALLNTTAVIEGLKTGQIGYLGLDVYEEEDDMFFQDLSGFILQDDVFARLLTFPNVLITGHQAFFTQEALEAIASTTVRNIEAFARGEAPINAVG
jgi:D-lactate dehydrogenase